MKILKAVSCLLTVVALVPVAGAQDQNQLDIKTVVQKQETSVTDAGESQTQLVAADSVVPGDEVIYTVSFANTGDEPAEDVVITNPLPEQLTYVEGSAFGPGADVQFSIDGGQSFAAPEELLVSEDGFERPARNDDFTHIRWVMSDDIEPGAQGMAQFRAKLN